jgi:hypothetical protein
MKNNNCKTCYQNIFEQLYFCSEDCRLNYQYYRLEGCSTCSERGKLQCQFKSTCILVPSIGNFSKYYVKGL